MTRDEPGSAASEAALSAASTPENLDVTGEVAGDVTSISEEDLDEIFGPTQRTGTSSPASTGTDDSYGRKSGSKRQPPLRLGELLDRPELLVPPVSLIPYGIAQAGRVTILSAREKAGKSTLVGQAAAALSAGEEFLGEQLSKSVVLWYAIDEPLSETVSRFSMYGADRDTLRIQSDRPTAQEMRSEILSTGAKVVVIDTLAELWSGRVEDDKDALAVLLALRPFIEVVRELGVALVILHHTTKVGAEYRGSVQIGASADVMLTLRPPTVRNGLGVGESAWEDHSDDGRRILRGSGRGGVRVDLRLSFDGDRYSLGDKPLPFRMRVLSELVKEPTSGNGLAQRLGVRKQRVLEELKDLRAEGMILPEGRLPEITELGRAALTSGTGAAR